MSSKQEELLNKKSEALSLELQQALLKGDFHGALTASITRSIWQGCSVYRMDFTLKLSSAEKVAVAVTTYANTMQGFGFNGDTALTVLQSGSGMFGLIGLNPTLLNTRFFDLSHLTFKETSKFASIAQSFFGAPKSLVDESKQYHRVIKQADLEEAKRRQEEYKEKIQRANAAIQESQQQLKTLEEAEHRAKMSAHGG